MLNRLLKIVFILLSFFAIQIFLMELTVNSFPKFNNQQDVRNSPELFDPSLQRLNSIEKFTNFCDSVYGSSKIAISDSGQYANMVSRVVRYRFQHGYTWYHFGHNYFAKLLAPFLKKDLSAIVVPDDILKYPIAACSQQSIVGMKVLMDKGFGVRKVGFYDSIIGGHFCYEVKYENDWHFYDPNREPDETVLNSYNRPGIEYLNNHPNILLEAYKKDSNSFVLSLYKTYRVTDEGILPGKNARLFQQLTKILSYASWIFLGLIYLFFEKRHLFKKIVK